MTTLAILNGDWEILFEDEVVGTATTGMRMVRRASGASATIYTSLQLYSAIADAADEFTAMGFRNPALPVTPNAFTLENQYFMPRSSTEWLKEGTWTADWRYVTTPNTVGNGVVCVEWSGGTGPAPGDIGRLITQGDSTDTGTLLDYETLPNGNTAVWIRPDDSTPTTGDVFDGTGTLIVTGGTMSATTSSNAVIGQTRYTAIQAIGSVPTATDVYIYQDRTKLTDWEGNFQWWDTDPTVSLGIISVLVRTHIQAATIEATTGIADSDLEVFARRYTSLYDNFRLNVAGGGFSALPLASSPDINNTTGYTNTGTLSGVTGSPTVGNGVYVGASWAAATAKGVITAANGTTDFDFYLIGDLTAIGSTTAVTGYDFVTAANDGFSATTGTTANTSGGPLDSTAGEGGTVTVALGHTTSDFDGDGTAEPFSVTVDCQTNVPVAKVYERIKYITRRGAPNTDLFGAGVNIPGESYRGLEALYYTVSHSATLTEGDNLTQTTGGAWTGRLIASNQTGAGQGVGQSYITTTDGQTSLESLVDADVVDDESADQATIDVDGAGGASLQISSPKSSPLGTFTGTTIFGAQGVLFSNIDNDPQAYTLTDDLGTLRTPPNTVTILIDNTDALDRVYVARDTGVAGVINKDRHGGMTVTAISATSITVGGSIDTEVPGAAWVRVIAVDELQEHHYKYDSRTTGASGVFTLTPITAASATAGTSDTALSKTGGPSFVTEGVEPGMLIHVATRTSTYEVVSVTDADNLVIQLLYGAGGFVSGDAYTINETIQGYDTNDNLHDLIIDTEATTTSSTNTLIKTPASNFGVVVNVRQGKIILPFTQNATVGDSGVTVTVVRQDDTIAV
jgi:hypothetical protein